MQCLSCGGGTQSGDLCHWSVQNCPVDMALPLGLSLHLVHFLCQESVPPGTRDTSGGNGLVAIDLDILLSFAGLLCSLH